MSYADFEVSNSAAGFMITSKGLAARAFSLAESDDKVWRKAVREGIFLLFVHFRKAA
jgi:hypothetical protein